MGTYLAYIYYIYGAAIPNQKNEKYYHPCGPSGQ